MTIEELKSLVKLLRDAAPVAEAAHLAGLPGARQPLADELTGFAYMLEATLEPTPVTDHEVKLLAYTLDPECWVSYSGKPREFKQMIERRRVDALAKARAQLS